MNTIGIIAGNGRFPFLVAEEIKRKGDRAVVFALNEETDPAIEAAADKTVWIALGQLQKLIDVMHAEKAVTAVMAGQVKHAQLFANLKLDWRAVKLLGRLINKKTDTILGAIADELAKEGIQLLPSHRYLTHLLAGEGIIAGRKLSGDESNDVDFGFRVAKQIAGLDIGQTVAVKGRAVLAVESIEGTNECVRRAAHYAGKGIIVAKVAKPAQDWRFDIPVIGTATIDVLKEVCARAIAVEAGSTLMFDRDSVILNANAAGITIIGVRHKE